MKSICPVIAYYWLKQAQRFSIVTLIAYRRWGTDFCDTQIYAYNVGMVVRLARRVKIVFVANECL